MKVTNKFQDRFCDLCQKTTIWYETHCTNHSNWKQGIKHVVPEIMVMGSIGNRKDTREPTEAEFRRINRMERKLLKVADDKQAGWVTADDAWAYGYFGMDPTDRVGDDEIKDPSKTYCTFCGAEVDHINLLTEKGKPRIKFSDEVVMDPETREIHTQRRLSVFAETLNACPNCVLKIRKPITVQRV